MEDLMAVEEGEEAEANFKVREEVVEVKVFLLLMGEEVTDLFQKKILSPYCPYSVPAISSHLQTLVHFP